MISRHAVRTTAPWRPIGLVSGVLIGGAVIAALLVSVLPPGFAVSSTPPIVESEAPVVRGTAGGLVLENVPGSRLEPEPGAAVGVADGVVPEGTTVFDAEYPGVANLVPALLDALRRAATDAADQGIAVTVDSGWRSSTYQAELFRQAIVDYGSEVAAARWVARPGTSTHESGSAVDIGSSDAVTWLSENGAAYGLCPVYRNEPWHFEHRPDAVKRGCPLPYADPTEDPRMRP